jgi:hypothetical protein
VTTIFAKGSGAVREQQEELFISVGNVDSKSLLSMLIACDLFNWHVATQTVYEFYRRKRLKWFLQCAPVLEHKNVNPSEVNRRGQKFRELPPSARPQ